MKSAENRNGDREHEYVGTDVEAGLDDLVIEVGPALGYQTRSAIAFNQSGGGKEQDKT